MPSILGGILQATGAADPHLPRRNPTNEARQWLRSLPQLLQAQTFYDPQLSALAQQSSARNLFGTEGGTESRTYYGLERQPGTAGRGRPLVPTAHTMDVNIPSSEGLLSLAGRAGTGLRDLTREMDPEYSNLLESLLGAAQEDVTSGYEMSPAQLRQVQQYIRAGQASRGTGYGTADTVREAVAAALRGTDVREQRLGSARATAGLYRSSLPSWENAMALASGSGTLPGTSSFVNPYNPYAQDVANTNYGARTYEEIAQKNNRIQGLNSIAEGTMQLGSMIMGGMGGGGGGGGGGGMMSMLGGR